MSKSKRPGKRERKALKAAQAQRKAIISANLSNPKPVETWSNVTKSGHMVMGYNSTCAKSNLLGNSHTRGFHSSSIRGHREPNKTPPVGRWSDR